jgi:hypothetical protein
MKKIAGGKLTEKLRNTWRLLGKYDEHGSEIAADTASDEESGNFCFKSYRMGNCQMLASVDFFLQLALANRQD